MKRVLAGVLMAILAFSLMGCVCSIDKKAVGDLQATDKIILPAHNKYVEADLLLAKLLKDKPQMTIQEAAPLLGMGKISPEQADDRKKLIESLVRLVEAMADHVK